MKKILLISGALVIVGCTGATLADRISLGLMQREAIQSEDKAYCYATDDERLFCLVYMGKAKKGE